jgi:hypothetical protein
MCTKPWILKGFAIWPEIYCWLLQSMTPPYCLGTASPTILRRLSESLCRHRSEALTRMEGIGLSGWMYLHWNRRYCQFVIRTRRSISSRTSLAALTLKTPYAMTSIPPNTMAVLLFQFAGRVHHPPCERSFKLLCLGHGNAHRLDSRLVSGRDIYPHCPIINALGDDWQTWRDIHTISWSLRITVKDAAQPLSSCFGTNSDTNSTTCRSSSFTRNQAFTASYYLNSTSYRMWQGYWYWSSKVENIIAENPATSRNPARLCILSLEIS